MSTTGKTPRERSKELWHERFLFFSDAIFAIAITLTVLPIVEKLGHIPPAFGEFVLAALPLIASFIVTFIVVALYWRGHSRLLYYLVRADDYVVLWNMLFLGSVTFLPLSSTALSNSFQGFFDGNAQSAALFAMWYSVNLLTTSLTLLLLWCRLLWTPADNDCEVLAELKTEDNIRYHGLRMGITSIIFFLCALTFLVSAMLSTVATFITAGLAAMLWVLAMAYNLVNIRPWRWPRKISDLPYKIAVNKLQVPKQLAPVAGKPDMPNGTKSEQ
ncbi:MAG: TMEM175 family protein [Chloroflexia bacterium]